MVYRGPSKGCATCRRRRVKCDERTPCCGNCAKLKIHCPGYGDVFDRSHRSETAKVVETNSKHANIRRASRGNRQADPRHRSFITVLPKTTIVSPRSSTQFASNLEPRCFAIRSPLLDSDSAALCFFFLAYGPGRYEDATCSPFELLPDLYAQCRPNSPLALATTALAIKISGLWHQLDGDVTSARRRYLQAVSLTKEAIKYDKQSKSNELLMTTLVLEAYDGIDSQYQHGQRSCVHLSGSVALLKHRGLLNYRDNASRRMLLAVRNKLAYDALTTLLPSHPDTRVFFQDVDQMPSSPAIEVDKLAMRVVDLFHHPSQSCGLEIAADCLNWIRGLPEHWQAIKIDGDQIENTIKRAGLYGESCDMYANFSIAMVRNWHRLVELYALQILGTSLTDNESPLSHRIKSRVGCIVDEICASVPFHIGDMMEPCNPVHEANICFPHTRVSSLPMLATTSFPESISQHKRQIACSGGMAIYRVLSAVLTMSRVGDEAAYIPLGDDQKGWISGQITRLERMLRFPTSKGRHDKSSFSTINISC